MSEVKIVPWETEHPPTEQVAEAKLHAEGYESFRWQDVQGANYPKHRHEHAECIWVLKGQIIFEIDEKEYTLKPGDRIYLPSRKAHTVRVPLPEGVVYLVGEKK